MTLRTRLCNRFGPDITTYRDTSIVSVEETHIYDLLRHKHEATALLTAQLVASPHICLLLCRSAVRFLAKAVGPGTKSDQSLLTSLYLA